MSFANTFITLSDVDITSLQAGKFLRVRPSGNLEISQYDITTDTLTDVVTSGAYTPSVGQTLVYSADGKWRPGTLDVYSAGNGLNKAGLTLNVTAGTNGGLVSNSSGVYIADVTDADNVAAVHGNATHVPVITVGRDGRITGVTPTEITVTAASSLTADYVGNVVGTSGQITVTGGTGNNSNATLNLVATGVTAGIYGNATAIPRITVDTYGRISSVDVVSVVASGNGSLDTNNVTTLAYSNIHVSGQTSLGADRKDDDLTFAGGLAIDATTDANTDTIYFALNPTDAAANMSISGFSDVDASGITNGQVLIWNSSTSKFEAGDMTGGGGSGNSNVSLTDFSVTTATPSGNGSLTYNNAGVFTFTPANVQSGGIDNSGVDSHLNTGSALPNQVLSWNGSDYAWVAQSGGSTQSLTWDSGTSNLSISSGNSVDLSTLSQTLSIAGNVITISGSSDTVDLTSALGNVAGNYGDSNVAIYLSTNGYSNVDVDAQDISITGNVISLTKQSGNVDLTDLVYANTKVQAYVDTLSFANISYVDNANTNMQAYVDALETRIIGGANVNLDSLAEVANALANSNTELSTVAFTGTFSDLQSRPAISLAGSDLTYDGTTLDLSGVGAVGPQGNAGADGVSITSATLSSDNLILTLSNASTIDAGNVRGPVGPTGATGPQGDGNAGISSASITGSGNLILTLNDSTTVDAGNVKGDTGATGATGVGITSTTLVGSNLVINYSNTSTQDLGNIQGPQGDAGTNGVDVSTATVNGSGNLIITLSNASTIDAGNVRGVDGTVDQTLSLAGNVITISGSNSNVDLTSALSGSSGTPGGSDGQLQYNNGGSFGGIADLHWDDSNDRLGIGTSSPAVKLHISGDAAQESQLRMSQYNNDADAPDIRFFKARGTEATPTNISAGDKLAAFNVEARTGGAFKEMGTISFVSSSTNTGASVLKFGTKSNSEASNLYPSTKFEITEEGNIKFNNTYTFPSSDGSAGQVLQTDGSGTLSFATVSGGGSSYADSNVDAHLNVSGASTNEVLSWDGSDYAWVAQSGGGSGDITSVVAGVGLTGGATSGDATIDLANTAVTPGSYGSATKSPRITVDQQGRITSVTEATISGGGGGGGATIERFKLNYASNGTLAGTSDLTSGITGVTINSSTGGEVSIAFDNGSYNLPPGAIMFYGYDYTNNKYSIVPFESSMGYREIDAGGSSGSPTLFDGSSTLTVKLRLREAETGASRGGFGTTTHAWIQFVMYD